MDEIEKLAKQADEMAALVKLVNELQKRITKIEKELHNAKTQDAIARNRLPATKITWDDITFNVDKNRL